MSVFKARKQQLDLTRLHEECERNFRRLQRVIPESKMLGATTRFYYEGQSSSGMIVEIIEVTKYTSTLLIIADRGDRVGYLKLRSRCASIVMRKWRR